MIVEIVPAHGDPITRPYDIALPIVLVWSRSREVSTLEFIMVDPHSGAVLDRYPVIPCDTSDTQVANDDVGLRFDVEAVR